ncbi:MAG: HU family DNA-binding protein [Ignavibacteria bacterium]|nr:HU family DNA-binding protein [Ignavibacteria bacterium]
MNKAQLVEAIAKAAGLSKSKADVALNATISAIKAELGKGGSVSLIGFGSFSVGKRGARAGRNPATGATIKIAARKVAKFSAGANLKAVVNGAKKAAPKAAAKKAAPKKAAAKKKR